MNVEDDTNGARPVFGDSVDQVRNFALRSSKSAQLSLAGIPSPPLTTSVQLSNALGGCECTKCYTAQSHSDPGEVRVIFTPSRKPMGRK